MSKPIAVAGALAVLATASTAHALPISLDRAALDTGADAIASVRVTRVTTAWNADHSGLETTIEMTVGESLRGSLTDVISVVQPGGSLDGAHHVIVGMPVFAVGDEVVVHLRRSAADRYRVYGWSRGVQWVGAGERPARTLGFTLNGMEWEPGQIPVEFVINNLGADGLDVATARTAILDAFATWESIACSSLRFLDGGDTDLGLAVDGINVITWIESDWMFGDEAAGAASLFFAPGQPPTADVALNGQHFDWAIGVPSVGPATQDVQGVMTHELGHFSGLGHSDRSIDTMYFSWTPWQSQRSLSADDKLALCTLYPQAGDECDTDGDCAGDATCLETTAGRLCDPPADPIGADCNRDRIECESFCLFANAQLTIGYCSDFCDETPCPLGFECNDASAGTEPVRVCFRGDPCSAEQVCQMGRFCGADGFCTFECRETVDCPAGQGCNFEGRCAPFEDDDPGGCGCRTASSSPAGALFGLFVLALVWRRRRA